MALTPPPKASGRAATGGSEPHASAAISGHYDDRYFAWQTAVGEFGGWANRAKFAPYINEQDAVLDFGCGGGFLLKGLACGRRIGVEVNPAAISTARANGIEIYANVKDVPGGSIDIVISNHALEHALHPLQELRDLLAALKAGGMLILFVPCESASLRYRPHDINHHLYSWSPMCLGNLLSEAGYEAVDVRPFIHKWPPGYRYIARYGGRSVFEVACRIYGRLERSWTQVRAIARKPADEADPIGGPRKGADNVVRAHAR